MHTKPDPHIISALNTYSRGAGGLAMLVGALALLGWALEVSILKSLFTGVATMQANAALCFLLIGLSLWLRLAAPPSRKTRLAATVCAGVAAGMALLNLIPYHSGFDGGIDALRFRNAADAAGNNPARMSYPTTLAFLLSGPALLLLETRYERLARFMAFIVALICLLVIGGYIYNVKALYSFGHYSSMALHSASIMALLSTGIMVARPDRGIMAFVVTNTAGAIMVRRLLPVTLVTLLTLQFLGLAGKQAGLYGVEFGNVFLALLSVIVVIVLVWMNGRTLHQLDLDRQAANNARRDSERHFRALIENSSDAITLVDAKGTTTSASPAVNRILGYTISEFVGWNSFEFVHPDDREMTERAFAEIVKQPGKMATRQFRLRHKDGSWRWMEGTSANLLDEPSVRAIVDNFRDITERKQVEEALHESELRLRLFVEYAPAAIAMLDRNMQYLAVSRRWLADYRLGEQQIVGRSHYEIFPEIPERWMEIHRRCLAGAVEKCEEDPFPRADGSMDWVKWEIHPWHEKTGGVGGIIMFTEVITERKQAEERLQAYAAKLEQSNRELQDFASVASHDLQEPLRKIQAFGERLKAKCGEALDDHQAREYLERMLNAAARMRTLINDLLAFSRVITKAQPFAPVDLAEVTREVLSDLEISIEQTGARVEVGELPVVEVDSRQIRQLLQNLIGNALKFHRPGEAPVVRISGAITEDGQQRENRNLSTTALCQLRVTDNGIGFDEKYLDRIFNIFEKLHGRNEFEGTGIGLAICRKIAERHGGSITATSKPGHGATFIVSLPVKQVKGEHAV